LRRVLAAALVLIALLTLSCAPQAGPPPASPPARPQKPASPKPSRSPVKPARAPAGPPIAVLQSGASLRISSWIGEWETEGAIHAFRRLGIEVRMVSDQDLVDERLAKFRILVVPNARCVSRDGAEAVRRYVEKGGRLLATEMASYRDEGNKRVGTENNFQWADLFGADFQRWVSGPPNCEYLELDGRLASEVGAALGRKTPLPRIQLGRNTAMLVSARPEARILATWVNVDGMTPTSDAGSSAAAIVQSASGRVIYAGENLPAPELSRSREVQALLLALLRRLDGADSNFPRVVPASATGKLDIPTGGPSEGVAPIGALMRVAVRDASEAIGLASGGGLRVTSLGGPLDRVKGNELLLPAGTVIELRPVAPALGRPYVAVYGNHRLLARGESGVAVASQRRAEPLGFLDLRPNGTCRAQAFRGLVEVRARNDRLQAINVLPVNQYVAGVVPNEVPGTYPPEALRAMAVIARTFALSRRDFHRSDGHDVCSTVHCQVYGGMLTEWGSTSKAVNATRDEVVKSGDAFADATFHAVCGGVGENVELVWPQPPTPYLVAHSDGPDALPDLSSEDAFRAFIDNPPDAYCETSPRFRWTETYTLPQLQTVFQKSLPVTLGADYHGLGTLKSVRVAERSRHGRVQRMRIEGTEGTCEVTRDKIRWLWSGGRIGQGGLQSTLFYIVPQPDGRLVFRGGGWGHGVGMCQEGAAGMASRGLDHAAIIKHYYPGTRLVQVPIPGTEESP